MTPLPCPFCGKVPKIWQNEVQYPFGPVPTDWVLTCCISMEGPTKDILIHKWNQRVHIKLDTRQQDIMALLCVLITPYVRRVEDCANAITKDDGTLGIEEKPGDLADALWEWAFASSVTSQELGTLYDKFHRTGANA